MAEYFFTKLSRRNNFQKMPARVEIFALFNPKFEKKHEIPMVGTIPLSPVIIDNSQLKYCVYAEKIILLKHFDFVPFFKVENFSTVFPFPSEYILSKLNAAENKIFSEIRRSCNSSNVEFFQNYVPAKK
jgi:hypothetical protein